MLGRTAAAPRPRRPAQDPLLPRPVSPVSTSSSAPAFTSDAAPGADFYARADALYRCAVECARQHERASELDRRAAPAAEQRAARALAALATDALEDLGTAYAGGAGAVGAPRDACWHAANGLWLAAREVTRRRRTSARAGRGIGEHGDRSGARLAELALDYDLEASALLLLKQATEAYRRTRPEAA